MRGGCAFCDYDGPREIRGEYVVIDHTVFAMESPREDGIFVIEPLNPVTDGHLLVIPRKHHPDFRLATRVLGDTMAVAAYVAGLRLETPGCNLIVSAGEEATQTVPHVHAHVVPRREGDGLKLPWSSPARPVHQYECARDNCGVVVEVKARIGAVPTPRCPVHTTVPMLLAGYRDG